MQIQLVEKRWALALLAFLSCLGPLKSSAQYPQPNLSTAIIDGYIEGKVIDPQGKPVEGAYVYSVGSEEGKRPLGGRWPPGPVTTTGAEGRFVLLHVPPDNPVSVYASKESDYYGGYGLSLFLLPNAKAAEVEVKLGQPVNVTVQLGPKVGKIQWNVYDADTRELVHGIFMQSCRKGTPAKYCVGGMSGPSVYSILISPGLDFAINIEADDGLHEKWEYRNPKTGSRYFRAKSGKTETLNVYLRKKGTIAK
jgi:hypothetical protein